MKKAARQSSRYPFIAEHRGGPLTKEQHRQLIHWACECILHVVPLFGKKLEGRLKHALKTAKSWEEGNASVGDARKAAFGAIDAARELTNPVQIAIARGVGHAVATAHMADHAPGAAEYALTALACEGRPIDAERKWQDKRLPCEIQKLVLLSRKKKSRFWQTHRNRIQRKCQNVRT